MDLYIDSDDDDVQQHEDQEKEKKEKEKEKEKQLDIVPCPISILQSTETVTPTHEPQFLWQIYKWILDVDVRGFMTHLQSRATFDSPNIVLAPGLSYQLRFGPYAKDDDDTALFFRWTHIPKIWKGKHISTVEVKVVVSDFQTFTLRLETNVPETDHADFQSEWSRSAAYQSPRERKQQEQSAKIDISVQMGVGIWNAPRILQSVTEQTTSRSLESVIGLMPDVSIVLANNTTIAVHSNVLREGSEVFRAHLSGEWKDRKNIEMQQYHPLAVRAFIHNLYTCESCPERSLHFILKVTQAVEKWHILADTLKLADLHFAKNLFRSTQKALTSYIPVSCLRKAMELAVHSSDFQDDIIKHVQEHARRFLVGER